MFKNKYDILEDYLSSLQKEKVSSVKKARGNPELEQVLQTTKKLKVLLGEERAAEKSSKKGIWYWLLAPVVTTAVIIIGIIFWSKGTPDYSQEIAELTSIEQELDESIVLLEKDLEDLEGYLREEEINAVYKDLQTL